jgi:hypothetical protein
MVAAGVYMLVRVAFLIEASATALAVIAWIGIITAVMAALIATQQNDIKRILAYSTLSQLGYMVMAVGLASGDTAMFHLFTHAFFKALLFLGAGSIIIMLHHEQNIWKMGGLAGRLRVTFGTFLIGTLALIGCPPFSGFFSKDAILAIAYQKNQVIFWLALFTAFLTAFLHAAARARGVLREGAKRTCRARQRRAFVMSRTVLVLAVPLRSLASGSSRSFLTVRTATKELTLVPYLANRARCSLASIAAFASLRKIGHDRLHVLIFERPLLLRELYAWLIRNTRSYSRISQPSWTADLDCGRGAWRQHCAWGFFGRRLLDTSSSVTCRRIRSCSASELWDSSTSPFSDDPALHRFLSAHCGRADPRRSTGAYDRARCLRADAAGDDRRLRGLQQPRSLQLRHLSALKRGMAA